MKQMFSFLAFLLFFCSAGVAQHVWLLNDNDPDYLNPPFNDSLKLFTPTGSMLTGVSGFNLCEQIPGNRKLAVHNSGQYCWVTGNMPGESAYKIGTDGSVLAQIQKELSVMDLHSGNNLYALRRTANFAGDSIYLFDPDGGLIKAVRYGGTDLVVDEARNAVWIAGTKIIKLDLDLNFILELDPIVHAVLSLDYSADGSVWVCEEKHFQVPGSKDRLLHISPAGEILDSIDLQERPTCLRVNRNDGMVWVAAGDIMMVNPATLSVTEMAAGGFTLCIDHEENVWVAGKSSVLRKLSKTGELLLSIPTFFYGQAFVATEKEFPTAAAERTFGQTSLFSLFPNPASSSVTISSLAPGNERMFILIRDLAGKILYAGESATKVCRVDLTTFPSGIYLVTVKEGEQESTRLLQMISERK